MITILNDAPANVAAFRATGDVDVKDYDNTVIPAVEAMLQKEGKINFMLVLDTSIAHFSVTALLKDLAMGLKHFTKWHKMAIVSESSAVNTFTDFFSYIAPGESKGFTHAQIEEAKKWVST